ncbi:hypothetical protein HanIR_Chr09g0395671 [Helianthus annuus]|nr:hypothetical protein HanIR_Chr09g0395671 [Helianthus annuus]
MCNPCDQEINQSWGLVRLRGQKWLDIGTMGADLLKILILGQCSKTDITTRAKNVIYSKLNV